MNKTKCLPYMDPKEFGVTELTVEDITKNLQKPLYGEVLDLENVYDFLRVFSSTKGKSGFISIKRNDSSKELTKGIGEDSGSSKTFNKSPALKGSTSSPVLSYTLSPSRFTRKINQNQILESIEEKKTTRKQLSRKKVTNKSVLGSPKSISTKFLEYSKSQLKPKAEINKETSLTEKERALSPYVNLIYMSTGKLPLLQSTKRKIKVLKYDKKRKKSCSKLK